METKQEPAYKLIEECLCCGSNRLFKFLSLGDQPPPNAFASTPEKALAVQKFPLETRVCERCYHSQLCWAVRPQLLFNDSYPYRTGVSKTLTDYYASFAAQVVEYWDMGGKERKNKMSTRVLDIGCNDGTLLAGFKKVLGPRCILAGVDMMHAPGIQDIADLFYVQEWGTKFLELQPSFKDRFIDIITGTNVLAHTPRPKEFITACYESLSDNGVAVFEFPHGGSLISDCLFDTIYHEHYSYFNTNSFLELLRNTGLYVQHLLINPGIHGGSIRFYLRRCEKGSERFRSWMACKDQITQERDTGLYQVKSYVELQGRLDKIRDEFCGLVKQAELDKDANAVVFGASGKSTVMLNYFRDVQPDYIVDETPAKQGMYSPGRGLKVLGCYEFRRDRYERPIVICSWNCMQESIHKIGWARHVGPQPTRLNTKNNKESEIILTYLPKVSSRNFTPPDFCHYSSKAWDYAPLPT